MRSTATNATRGGRWKDLPFSALTLQLWKKTWECRGCSLKHLLPGLGQRPVSEAHAFEFKVFESKNFESKDRELKKLPVDSKSTSQRPG